MKNKLLAIIFVLATVGFLYLPASAKTADANNSKTLVEVNTANALNQVRYVRVRGKRYKVWYKTFRRNGRRYVRVTKIRRA